VLRVLIFNEIGVLICCCVSVCVVCGYGEWYGVEVVEVML